MDLKTVCLLFLVVAVTTSAVSELTPVTGDDTSFPIQRSRRQFFGYPGVGSTGIASAQASAISTGSGGFPGYGGGLSAANAAAFAGSNSFGK